MGHTWPSERRVGIDDSSDEANVSVEQLTIIDNYDDEVNDEIVML